MRLWAWSLAIVMSAIPMGWIVRKGLQPPPRLRALDSVHLDTTEPLVNPTNRRPLVRLMGEDGAWAVLARWDGSMVALGLDPDEMEEARKCMKRALIKGDAWTLRFRCHASQLAAGAVSVSPWEPWWLIGMPFIGLAILFLSLVRDKKNRSRLLVTAMRMAARNELDRLPPGLQDTEEGRALLLMLSALQEKEERLRELLLTVSRQKSQLEQARQALKDQERLALVGTMASGMAHELGNPLASIMGIMEVWEDASPEERKRLGEMVRRELNRMDRIIRALLGAARPPSGERKPMQLGEIIQQAWTLVSHRKDAREVRLHVDDGCSDLMVQGSDELPGAFVNLFLNSVHAMQGAGEISITCDPLDDEMIAIIVGDSGPGIPPEVRERIFDPFFTTKEPGQGTGLGLTAVMGVIEGLGGTITLLDRSPGAFFEIRLKRSNIT